MKKTNAMRNCAVLSGAALCCLAGCNTLFDAPSESVGSAGLSARELSDLQTLAQTQSLEAAGAVAGHGELTDMTQTAASQGAAAARPGLGKARPSKVTLLSNDLDKEPVIHFEKIASQIPQLVVLSAGGTAIWWSGQALQMPQGNASHVFLVQPGRHELTIAYPGAKTFKAEVLVSPHERITLRVDAVPPSPLKTKP